jgi:hypothetical protein
MKSRGRLFLFLIVALLIGGWYLWPKLQNHVVFQNHATKTVKWVVITNGTESQRLSEIGPGEARTTSVPVGQDNYFAVSGEFDDGLALKESSNHVRIASDAIDFKVVISVLGDGTIQVVPQPPKDF